MTNLLLILILIIGLACIGMFWFTKRKRLDLLKARANEKLAIDGHVNNNVGQAQTEPARATCNEKAPVVELAHPTSPEESHPITDRPLSIVQVQTSFAPEKEMTSGSPVTEKTTDITTAAEKREVKVVQSSQAQAPMELSEDVIEKGNENAPPVLAKTIVDEVQLPVQPEQEKTEAIPDTRSQKPPIYQPPVPVPPVVSSRTPRQPSPRSSDNRDSELHLSVHLVFDRRDGVRSLSLVPDCRAEMPAELDVAGTQGDFALTQLQDGCYQDVNMPDIESALRKGVDWQGKGVAHRRWRWVLGGRELYVLAPGGEVGLSGFVSVPRLLLGEEHVVLALAPLRVEVLSALAQAGCAEPVVFDQTFPGVPSGWLLFRGVRPTRAVPARDERHILNALCPLADIAPHFVGGIRLEARTWLLGHPPCIRFTGQLDEKFAVMIDGQKAVVSEMGGYIAPGWDSEGIHRLWFAEQSVTYELHLCNEGWAVWSAYDFGTGATICGACTHPAEKTQWRQVRVPSQNPVLIGSEPGEIFHCHLRSDIRADAWPAIVPFAPVWALPTDPAHVDKQSVRVALVGELEPVRPGTLKSGSHKTHRTIATWCAAINDAGRKGLALATDDANAVALWRSYRREAKRLWRAMR